MTHYVSRAPRFSGRLPQRLSGLLAVVALAGCGSDATTTTNGTVELDPSGVHVANVWVQSPDAEGTTSAVGALLYTTTGDRLVFVEVDPDMAARASFVDANGASIDAIEIPAGLDLVVKPSTSHVVLEDLGPGFSDASSVQLTFNFESSPPRTIEAEIRDDS